MKRITALICIVCILCVFVSSCTPSSEETSATPAPTTASPSDSKADPTPAPTPKIDESLLSDVYHDPIRFEMVGDAPANLPLVDEPVIITAWWPFTSTYISNFNETQTVMEMESLTGVHVEYFHPSTADVNTLFPLMIAADDLMDLIYYSNKYVGGGDVAVDSGTYIRLNELIEEHAPNYNAARNFDDGIRKSTISSQGNIWGFYAICSDREPGYQGLVVRQDYLLMNDWYNKQYIKSDFFGETTDLAMQGYATTAMGEGRAGSADGNNMFGAMLYAFGRSEDPDIFITSVLNPTLNKGDDMHFRMTTLPVKQETLSISSSAKNPELIVKWIDCRYTNQFISMLTYGVEGVTNVRQDDGLVRYTKSIVDKIGEVGAFEAFSTQIPGLPSITMFDWAKDFEWLDPVYAENIMFWKEDGDDYILPEIELLTNDDASEYAKLFTDIEAYIDETVPKIIIGQFPLSDFDKFVNQLKTMGIERCIELKQLALDDYNNR